MDKQYRQCAESKIDVIPPNMYHQVTLEILRHYNFIGTPSKISQDYWREYIDVYNGLIDKCEKELNK